MACCPHMVLTLHFSFSKVNVGFAIVKNPQALGWVCPHPFITKATWECVP